MSTKRNSFLIGSIVIVAMGLVAPAQAFNPQPDPPARGAKNSKTSTDKNSIKPGDSGLLNSGSGFSTQTPSSVGTPIGGGARGGGASTR